MEGSGRRKGLGDKRGEVGRRDEAVLGGVPPLDEPPVGVVAVDDHHVLVGLQRDLSVVLGLKAPQHRVHLLRNSSSNHRRSSNPHLGHHGGGLLDHNHRSSRSSKGSRDG